MRSEKEFKVVWEIDVQATDPIDAAKVALEIMQDKKSTANVFKISDENGVKVEVDIGGGTSRWFVEMKIYNDAVAKKMAENNVGKKFRPSGSGEGMMFLDLWCGRCAKDKGLGMGCEIADATAIYTIMDEHYPIEWQFGKSGHPICTAFEQSKASMAVEILVGTGGIYL